MEVININTFLMIKEAQYKSTCELFGEDLIPKKLEVYKNNMSKKYQEIIQPILDKKFQFVGSENSLFDPLRKIEMVWFDNGVFYEVFRYKGGRKKFTSKIDI